MYTSKINIKIRDTILDPQGKAVEHSLKSLGFDSVTDTRIGKFIELKIDAKSEEEAKKITEETCRKLLANPVMEDYEFIVSKDGESK
ncbi:MAG TPA: phosphoribosylformylglycinamidine synthase subunit PurS [Ignavibacteria bacterium]|nr:phosphoribosylformylglycinamidine synthase subunit PurS [Ignavibacteria bacterium]HRJ98637.1 phosphoribosylformylglycinamidine synthase subunit PurS [Ignavibacteria bacterium]